MICHIVRFATVMLFLAGFFPAFALGDTASPTEDGAAAPAEEPDLREMLGSPQATMRTFLTAVDAERFGDAVTCLDPAGFSSLANQDAREETAQRLKTLIDRMWRVEYYMIPEESDAPSPWNLEPETDFVISGRREGARRIEIVRGDDELWRFSADTVKAVDELWSLWADEPLEEAIETASEQFSLQDWLAQQFPPRLRQTNFFLIPDYHWISLLVLIVVGVFVDRVARELLYRLTVAWLKYVARRDAPEVDRRIWRPVGLLVQATVWYLGTKAIGLSPAFQTILLAGLKLFTVVAAVWTGFLLVNVLASFLKRKASHTATKFDDLLVPLVSKSLKVVVVCAGIVSAAQALSMPLAGVIGGLGIGGLALGLAAQDSIKNFFGSVMIFTDRPFELGDRIVVDGFDGPVEAVGFRSTRIRTLEGHVVTIPNGELANKLILNIGKRPHIRRIMNITITYDTPQEKIERAVEIVKEILADHEGSHADYPPRAFFNELNADSLNIFAIYWYHPPDYWKFCAFNERVNMELFRRFAEERIEFAFPTQTLFLAGDPNRPFPADRVSLPGPIGPSG